MSNLSILTSMDEAKQVFESWMRHKGITEIHYLTSIETTALKPNGEPIHVVCWEFLIKEPYKVFTVYSDGSVRE